MTEYHDLNALQNGSDIRGIALGAGANLTAGAVILIGAAFLTWLSAKTKKPPYGLTVSVGMDSRLSGPALKHALTEGLCAFGARVYDCGLSTTPAMFMTTVWPDCGCDGAVMITASHLPADRNGLKFFTAEGGLEKGDISRILALAASLQTPEIQRRGEVVALDFLPRYARHLRNMIQKGAGGGEKPLAPFKICVDAGGGAGGFFASEVLAPLGADVSASRYLAPDGKFSHHPPNPEDPAAMASVIEATVKGRCDLGIIFDADVDRCALVEKGGKELGRNRLIALMSAIVLEEAPGSVVVTDSVTSEELRVFIESLGGVHRRFKRGYRNVINEAVRQNAEGFNCLLAMETSGHGALKENYFLDDGAYLAAKVLTRLARLHREGRSLASLLFGLKEPLEAAEIRLPIAGGDFAAYGKQVLEELFLFATTAGWTLARDNFEGVRVSFRPREGGGWFLLRMSLHEPLMPLNIESSEAGGCKTIARRLVPFLEGCTRLDLTPLSLWLEK